jgi:two-component system chemotaxis response regulator CheB
METVTTKHHGPRPIRVLLVDDSKSVRAVLRRFFARTEDVQVVGEAGDGAEAVAAAKELEPDVVLMDLQMPVMDGYEAIDRIMAWRRVPILVLSSRTSRNAMEPAFEAIRRGAVDVLPKPEDTASWQQLADTLPDAVRKLARVWRERGTAQDRGVPRPAPTPVAAPAAVPAGGHELRYVAVGAATGGPAAIRELLGPIPHDAPVAILVVQHIAAGFELGFADWLDREFRLDVRLAEDGETPGRGAVRLAPAGHHLLLAADGRLRLDAARPPRRGHRPSIDELFLSCAAAFPRQSAGVLLTGMGSDGVEGLGALRRAGALTLVQDEASSVVFGMNRAALEAGAAEVALPPRELGRTLVKAWRGATR